MITVGLMLLLEVGVYEAQSAVTYRTVAKTGDAFPGLPEGATYTTFDNPFINSRGDTIFNARSDGAAPEHYSNSIVSEILGTQQLVVRSGMNAPGVEYGTFSELSNIPVINDDGLIAFRATVREQIPRRLTHRNLQSMYYGTPGNLSLVAREDTPTAVPGISFPGNLGVTTLFTDPAMDTEGNLTFTSYVDDANTDEYDTAVWNGKPDSLSMVVKSNDPSPELGPDVRLDKVSLFKLTSHNEQGLWTRNWQVTGPGVDDSNSKVLIAGNNNSVRVVARTGDPAPGAGDDAVFTLGFGNSRINESGDIAFTSRTSDATNGQGGGIWLEIDGQIISIVQAGAPVPGEQPTTVFKSFNHVQFNNLGQIAFQGRLEDPEVTLTNDLSIWVYKNGGLKRIARYGDQAPGTQEGTEFWPGRGTGYSYPPVHLQNIAWNDRGQLAFVSQVNETFAYTAPYLGLWATDRADNIHLVVREGDLFDVDNDPLTEDLRTVSRILPYTYLTDSSTRTIFNNAGQLTFKLEFTDGTEGIFVATIGVPGDLNGDGFVGIADLNILLSNWNQTVPIGDPLYGDTTGDGFVGIADLNEVLGNWNAGTPPGRAIPEPATALPLVCLLILSKRRNT